MNNKWLSFFSLTLIVVMLTLALPGCGLPTTTQAVPSKAITGSATIPEVTLKRIAPNNLNLPGITNAAVATPEGGALLVNNAARIEIPAGAVTQKTAVTLKRFTKVPQSTSAPADAPTVIAASDVYDLGPDNVSFNQPVFITIGYEDSDIPAGIDESEIGLVLYDGQNWVAVDRQVDTENNLVTFKIKAFPGVAGLLVWPVGVWGWTKATALTGVLIGTIYKYGPTAYNNAKQFVTRDPTFWGRAAGYITPNDPTVQKSIGKMNIHLIGDSKNYKITDLKKNPDMVMNSSQHEAWVSWEINGKDTAINYQVTQNWETPADFLNNGLTGDCNDVANTMVSILRNQGFTARSVDGYQGAGRHAWAELILDGKAYYVGSRGEIKPLEVAEKELKLTRPQSYGEGYMWDENGQVHYKSQWWVSSLVVTTDASKAFPGGQVTISVLGTSGYSIPVDVAINFPGGKQALMFGDTDAATGKYTETYYLNINDPLGYYSVEANWRDKQIFGSGSFYVNEPQLIVNVAKSEYQPGEQVTINVKVIPAFAAGITIDSVAGNWKTDAAGNAKIVLNIPKEAKPGLYILTVRAPDMNAENIAVYNVILPPSVSVDMISKQYAPGDVFIVNVIVKPAKVTRITLRGYDGRWVTDKQGFAFPTLSIPKTSKPGQYTVTVDVPEYKIYGSVTYTVTNTPQVNTAVFNAGVIGMDLGLDITDPDGTVTQDIGTWGGNFLAGAMSGKTFKASGASSINGIPGKINYEMTFSDDFSKVVSGSVSFTGEKGQTFSYKISNIPRNNDKEKSMLEQNGLACNVYTVEGKTILDHFSGFTATDPTSSSHFSRYWANENCKIVVIIMAATDAQLKELNN
jgi:hypothetical protein